MKRALSPEKVQADGKIIEDLLDANQPDALLTFLANLEPPELYVLSKIPQLGQLRAFLNRPGVFKSLFDRRTENNGPEEDVAKFLESKRKSVVSYWKLWLASWVSVYEDDLSVELGDGLVRVTFEKNRWYDSEVDYLCAVSVYMNPEKLGKHRLDKFYIAKPTALRWHPKVLSLVDFIRRYVTLCHPAAPKSFKEDWEQRPDGQGYQHVYTFEFGSNVSRDQRFLTEGTFLPMVTLGKYMNRTKIEKLARLTEHDLDSLYARTVDEIDGVKFYEAENFVNEWCNYVQSFLFYALLENEKSAFLIVDRDLFGVDYLRSCVVCGEMANYHDNASFCGEKCFNFSVSGHD